MPLTIYKRGRFWWLTGSLKTKDGEKRVHESTGEADEAKADEVRLSRELEEREVRQLDPKLLFTFAAAVNDYLDAGKGDQYLAPLLQKFGTTRISAMTGAMVRAAAKEIYPGAAYTTWNRQVITPTKAVINLSADAGSCPPVKIKGFAKRDKNVRLPSTAPRVAVDRAYIDEFRAFCEEDRLRTLMLFIFQTGARIGDAIKLEPKDLDLPGRKATFRNMKNGEDGQADLTIELVYELQQLEARNGRVFGYLYRWSVYKLIKATCTRAGIPYLGTHQPGRHSFATEMIVRNRVDLKTTADKGNWKSLQVLMNNYPHSDTGPAVIDEVFGKKPGKKSGLAGSNLATLVTRATPARNPGLTKWLENKKKTK
jgi:integrase